MDTWAHPVLLLPMGCCAAAAGLIWNAILSMENSTKGRVAVQPAAGKEAQQGGSSAKR